MDEQLREKKNKRCVHSACAFNGNTHGVQKHSHSCVRPLYSQRNNRLVSTLRHFCGCHHYEKACQLDWQREARHFSSPKQTDTVAGSRKQPQLLPDRLDARRATRLCCHTHTHHTHKSIGPLSASSTRPDRVSLSACHSFSRHDTRLSNADSLPGIRRWTCAGVSSFSSFLETAHDNLG